MTICNLRARKVFYLFLLLAVLSLHCSAQASLWWLLLLLSTGSVVVVQGFSRSAAHGLLPDQRSNLCPSHWQEDCQPLDYQGSP